MTEMDRSGNLSSWEAAVASLALNDEHRELAKACYFDRPVLQAVQRYAESNEWAEMRQYLPKPRSGRALDVGAGNGIASYALAKDGWNVDATEPDPSDWVGAGAIRSWAESEAIPISVCDAYCESLPFPDNAFDVVVARQVMHHTKDLKQAYREIYRVLSPGGVAITSRDHVVSSHKQLQSFFERHPLHKLYGGENAFRRSEYMRAARLAGFRISHVLGSLSSDINLAPFTQQEVLELVSKRLPTPVSRWVKKSFPERSVAMQLLLGMASWIDRRPGRLTSLVLTK